MVHSLTSTTFATANIHIRRAFWLSVLCFFTLTTSCKKDKFKENNVGKGLLSENDLLGLSLIDTVSITSKTILADSLRTDEVSENMLLGSYVDPIFGKTQAEIYTQVRISGAVNFTPISTNFTDIIVDSFYLQLPLISTFYGELTPQTFEVYRLTENLFIDSIYYSNQTKTTGATNFVASGFETITPNTTASVVIDGETKVPMLRIRLDETLAWEIINETGNPSLASNDGESGFVKWFKGLYIKVNNPSQVSGDGAILAVNMQGAESKLVLNYRDVSDVGNEKKMFNLNLGAQVAYFNHFSHDYTSTSIDNQLNNPALGNTEFYIQTMAGLNGEIDFPFLKNLSVIENLIINKAELVFPFDFDGSSPYGPPTSLFLLAFSNEGEKIFLPDQFLGSIDGTANTTAKTYTFNITTFINRVIEGKLENSKLLISPVGGSVSASRVVVKGKQSSAAKPILKLYYSTY